MQMLWNIIYSLILALVPAIVSALVFALSEKPFRKSRNVLPFGKVLSPISRQVAIGIVFGVVCIVEIHIGINIIVGTGGTILVSACCAIPACTGLIFGGVSGLISTGIGCIYMAISPVFGIGTCSWLSDLICMMIAGILSLILRLYMLEGKRPTVFFSFLSGIALAILGACSTAATHISTPEKVTGFIISSALYSIICITFSLTASSAAVRLMDCGRLLIKKKASTRIRRVKAAVLISFIVTFAILLGMSIVFEIALARMRTYMALEGTENLLIIREVACTVIMGILAIATVSLLMYILIKRIILNDVQNVNAMLSHLVGESYDSTGEFVMIDPALIENMETASRLIANEMQMAGDIQLQALPLSTATFDGITINAFIKPARQVGGDFYDYFMLDKSNVVVLIADVSGKGISAAMFMMRSKAAIRDAASCENSPEEILNLANRNLYENNSEGIFVTMWLGIIDTETGVVTYTNAAQGDQIVRHPESTYEFINCDPEIPLAIKPSKKYAIHRLQMQPGSRLFLYTDGLTDACSQGDDMFGEERLLESLNTSCCAVKARESIDSTIEELDRFVGDAEQFDDITIMIIDFFGTNCSNRNFARVSIPATDRNLYTAMDFINESLNHVGCNEIRITEIDIAFEEIFVNVAHYAYAGSSEVLSGSAETGQSNLATIEISVTSGVATIRISDSGIPFNPLDKRAPDSDIPLKDRNEGGLGIVMVIELMDYVDYEYKDGKNIFTMMKIIK